MPRNHQFVLMALSYLQIFSLPTLGSYEDEPSTSEPRNEFGISQKFPNLGTAVLASRTETFRRIYFSSETEKADIPTEILRSLRTWPHDDPLIEKPWVPFLSNNESKIRTLKRIVYQAFANPLSIAVKSCDEIRVKEILREEANLNARDALKQTALHYLFMKDPSNCPEIKRVMIAIRLLEAGVDPNLRDDRGTNILHLTCNRNSVGGGGPANTAIAELILKWKYLNVNAVNPIQGKSALHYALRNDNPNLVPLLLERPDIDVFIRDKYGRKPLHYAVSDNHEGFILAAQKTFHFKRKTIHRIDNFEM